MAIGLVAGLCLFGEAGDADRVGGVLTAEKTAIGLRSRQMVMANVIGAPLEQRHAHRRSQRLPDRRDVLGEKLILKVLGAGRNNHLAAGKQRRNQVGKGLAGPRPGLGDEHPVIGNCRRNALGHLKLLRTQAIAGNRPGQQTVRRKNIRKGKTHSGQPQANRKTPARAGSAKASLSPNRRFRERKRKEQSSAHHSLRGKGGLNGRTGQEKA